MGDLRVLPCRHRSVKLVSWHRPLLGVAKLNMDGSSRGNPGLAATGGLIRDHLGRVLGAFGQFLGYKPILYAELQALLLGLELAVDLGCSSLIVESNSVTVISWVTLNCVSYWDYAYLIARIRHLCSMCSVQLCHVYREANKAADYLANWACTHQEVRHFYAKQDMPSTLTGILALDTDEVPQFRW